MSKSYVFIELDTTQPKLEIYAPRYTTQDIMNEITIEVNEKISDNHEVWVIDNNGDRHDYVFSKINENRLEGNIKFNNLPIGVSTINVIVSDEVGNKSEISSHSFTIKESLSNLFVKVADSTAKTKALDTSMKTYSSTASMKISIKDERSVS